MQQLVNRNWARAEQFKCLVVGCGQFGFAHRRHVWGTKLVARWLLQGLRSCSGKGFDDVLSPCTRVAPSRIRPLQSRLRGPCGEPGTANTSRAYSLAKWAVMSEPERGAALTTTTTLARLDLIRLWRRKLCAWVTAPRGD